MRKAIYKVIITFVFLIYPAGSFAENVERILFSGSELLYPLPKGFCNVTQEPQGILLMEYLGKQKGPTVPDPQIIIGSCQQNTVDTGYPWGWIGLVKESNTFTQKALNKMMAKMLENEDFMGKLQESASKKGSEAFEELFDVEMTQDVNKSRIVWADEHSILVLSNVSGQVGGNALKEVHLSSTTVIENLYVYTFLYNLEGANPSGKQLSKILIDNAPKIKKLN
ncbi:MAG: hypothetical protein CML95_05220 [Rhodobiaceae bacterium]|nr:hypothetical protein [Rhodobiaceae bacterium]